MDEWIFFINFFFTCQQRPQNKRQALYRGHYVESKHQAMLATTMRFLEKASQLSCSSLNPEMYFKTLPPQLTTINVQYTQAHPSHLISLHIFLSCGICLHALLQHFTRVLHFFFNLFYCM